MTQAAIRSDIAFSSADKVVVKGYDLPHQLMGVINFGDMAFLEMMDRLPAEGESLLFNAMLVSLAEHGITPSSLATRFTYLGAPEALQASVAAGLLGLGSVFVGSIEDAAKMLQQGLDRTDLDDLTAIANETVDGFRRERKGVPGIGHPIHKPVDPRAERLFELAAQTNNSGRYVSLMKLIAERAHEVTGRSLPVNATGAIAAIASELGVPWHVCRGLGVMARAVGLVGHILEESRMPMARDLWLRTEAEASAHIQAEP